MGTKKGVTRNEIRKTDDGCLSVGPSRSSVGIRKLEEPAQDRPRRSRPGRQLQPGHYELEWQGNGPAVKVSFLQNGKTVATVPATLKVNDSKVTEDDIVTRATSSKTKKLEEIDFLHQKEALMFGRKAGTNQSR
jgi:hypothetical protein